jgi:hypothetical protein
VPTRETDNEGKDRTTRIIKGKKEEGIISSLLYFACCGMQSEIGPPSVTPFKNKP